MAAADVQQPPPEPAPAVPDYLASPNAVFDDKDVQWRYGRAPDYSKTRSVWEKEKIMNHTAGSLPQLVENLVKNWEVEASFKPRLEDWRTIDHANYSFAINGGTPQTAEHMLKVGTYNAIITPNDYYDPANSDFASSHKTFKRMMPTFAWEVIEVYSGPPTVAFKWRHWGQMTNDYVGFNDKGEKITVKAHGGRINIEGVTVAQVDDKVRLQKVDTWFDPMEMFRQIAPEGIVNRQVMDRKVPKSEALDDVPDHNGIKIAEEHNNTGHQQSEHANDVSPANVIPPEISQSTGKAADAYVPHQGTAATEAEQTTTAHDTSELSTTEPPQNSKPTTTAERTIHLAETHGTAMPIDHSAAAPTRTVSEGSGSSSDKTWEKVERPDESDVAMTNEDADVPKDMERAVQPEAGEGVAAPPHAEETRLTHEEMSRITPAECPFLMNRE